jgi:hypothetical protein
MRTALLLALTAIIAFVGGSAFGVGGTLYLQDITARDVRVTSVLMYESDYDPTITGQIPQGYYVESTGVGRVYIETDSAEDYLGQVIQAWGQLATLCGPDGLLCYPVVRQATIVQTM